MVEMEELDERRLKMEDEDRNNKQKNRKSVRKIAKRTLRQKYDIKDRDMKYMK